MCQGTKQNFKKKKALGLLGLWVKQQIIGEWPSVTADRNVISHPPTV